MYTKGTPSDHSHYVKEEDIVSAFIKAFNQILENKISIIEDLEHVQVLLFDTSSLIEEQKSLDNELSITGQMMEKYTSGNLILTDVDRDTLSDLEKRYEKAEKRMQVLDTQIQDKQKRLGLMQQFTQSIKESKDVYTHFKAEDLYKTVDCIVVNKDCSFTIKFYSGQEITIEKLKN